MARDLAGAPSRPRHGRELAAAVALLTMAAAAVYGAHLGSGGFSNDDWAFASTTRFAAEPGLIGGVRAFGWMAFRPLAAVWWPLTHQLFGTAPAGHLATALGLAVAASAALFLLLRTLGLARLEAGAAAALLLVFPWADSGRLWAAASISQLGVGLFLLGLTVALRGLAAGGRRGAVLHAAAVALYLASLFSYEVAAGAVPFTVLLYRLRGGWRAAVPRWLVDCAVTGVAALLVTSHTWNVREPLSAVPVNAARLAFHGAQVLGAAALPVPGVHWLLGLAVLAAVAGAALWRARDGAVGGDLRAALALAAAACTAIVAGYLVFVTADPGDYSAIASGQGNRTNVLAAVGMVLLLVAMARAAGLLLTGSRRSGRGDAAALTLVVLLGAGFVAQTRAHVSEWADAQRVQRQVLAAVTAGIGRPAAGTTVIAVGFPVTSGPGVPTFAAPWDLQGALQLLWDDPTLRALPVLDHAALSCDTDGLAAGLDGLGAPQHVAYGNTFLVQVATARTTRLGDRGACSAALPAVRAEILLDQAQVPAAVRREERQDRRLVEGG